MNEKGENMKKSILSIAVILLFTALTFTACTDADKAPAELAIQGAEQAVNAAKIEIGKIAPDEIAAIEKSLISAKEKMAKKEYKAALAEAQAIVNKTKDAIAAAKAKAEAAKAKLAELTKKWTEMSEGLPKMIEAVQSRVDILSKSKKLPKTLTADKFAEAKAGLSSAKEDWTKAQESFTAGKVEEAVSAATAIKEKATKAMDALGMQLPEAAK
jgi:hypothetical protein